MSPEKTPGMPNQIYRGSGDYYVSYNDTDSRIYGCATTALVVENMRYFYILNGDHRAGYAQLMDKGIDACLNYFRDHIDQISKFSDRLEPLPD
jgi:hypothetical protein